MAQLVERDLAKVEAAGSSPVSRLKNEVHPNRVHLIFYVRVRDENPGPSAVSSTVIDFCFAEIMTREVLAKAVLRANLSQVNWRIKSVSLGRFPVG